MNEEQKEKFILLATVPEIEGNLFIERLKQVGINAIFKKDQNSSVVSMYQGQSFQLVNIFVKEEEYNDAKKIIEE
jgi:aspartate/glutamate racemase